MAIGINQMVSKVVFHVDVDIISLVAGIFSLNHLSDLISMAAGIFFINRILGGGIVNRTIII
jgi:hypothetical protein